MAVGELGEEGPLDLGHADGLGSRYESGLTWTISKYYSCTDYSVIMLAGPISHFGPLLSLSRQLSYR